MSIPLKVLMIEDSENDALLIIRALKKNGYAPDYKRVETAEDMRDALQKNSWDIIVCDYQLPGFGGKEAIALLKDLGYEIPLIVVSGIIDEGAAVDCMRLGAHDYVMKSNLSRLFPAIVRGLQENKIKRTIRQAKDELDRSEEKYRTILEQMEDGYFEVDLVGNFTFFNDALCRMYGYSKEELPGLNYSQYVEKEEGKKIFELFNKMYTTRGPFLRYSYELIRKDGTKKWIDATATLIKDAREKPTGFKGILRDMTGRREMENAIRLSEEKYRTIIEQMADGYFEVDLAGGFTFVNDAQCRNLGYSRKELMGMHSRQYTDEKNARAVYKVFNRVFKTGEPVNAYDLELIRKDGTKSYNEISVALIRDLEGKPVGFRGIARDVSDRKIMEDAVRLSEEKYRTIIEQMDDGYFEIDLAGNYTFVNDAECKNMGYFREELLGTNSRHFIEQGDQKKIFMAFNELYRTGVPIKQLENAAIKKDGTVSYNEISVSLIKNSEGKPIGFRGISRDVTERKKMEEELRKSLDRLRKSLGATINAMAVTVETRDPYTAGHQRRVADLARSIATEMGLDSNRIDGLRMASTIHDIGKISIPSEILTKPTKLSDLEFSLIKTHSLSGYNILKDIDFYWPIARMVLEHHERMNGSGYPSGLRAEEILLESRILAVADVVEAISSHRPYRAAHGIDAALDEIQQNSDIIYDPKVVNACLRVFRENGFRFIA